MKWGPRPHLTALPHPSQALIPEITGPLGHRQPPAEKELPELSHCNRKLQEETRGGRHKEDTRVPRGQDATARV